MRILSIDDDIELSILIKATLSKIDEVQVHCVHDFDAALRQLEDERFDLVLCDYRMPEGTGLELMAKVHDRIGTHIKVVFLTASAQRSEIDQMTQAGALQVLTKPFAPKELRAAVSSLLGLGAGGNDGAARA